MIERSRSTLAAFAADHPGLQSKEAVFGQYVGGTVYAVVAADAPSTRFLGSLGFRLPDELAALPILQAPGVTTIAAENLDLLDTADVAFFGIYSDPDRTEFTSQPLIAGSNLMTSGNFHYLTGDEAALLLGPNPAVTGALLEQLRPALEKLAA